MSITVVSRRQARPGQEAALLALGARLVTEEGPRWLQPRLAARLFQGRDAPAVMLYVAQWESRDAYWARMREGGADPLLVPLCVGEADRFFFKQPALYEIVSRRGEAAYSAILQCAPETSTAVRTCLAEELLPAVRCCPGFVLCTFCQDVDDPHRYLVLSLWASPAAREAAYSTVAPRWDATLREYGVRVEHFAGITRAESAGYPRGDAASPTRRPSSG